VFLEQYREKLLWRDETTEPTVVIDHRQLRLPVLDRLPRGPFLVSIGSDRRRIRIHDVAQNLTVRGAEHTFESS